MLEVINGFLLIYFLILCTLSALIPQLVKPIAACFGRPSSEERRIWSEIVELTAQQKGISMKDEFAAYSKLQRRINRLENQLKDDSQMRMGKLMAVKGTIRMGLRIGLGLMTVLSVIWFRKEPIVALKGDLFPLTGILRFPSDMPNAISSHVWVGISNFAVRTLLKPILS